MGGVLGVVWAATIASPVTEIAGQAGLRQPRGSANSSGGPWRTPLTPLCLCLRNRWKRSLRDDHFIANVAPTGAAASPPSPMPYHAGAGLRMTTHSVTGLADHRSNCYLITVPPTSGDGTTDLRAQLQASLGDGYALDRELGGAGMSRVFIAEETSLGRSVVVKVLPPEMAGGVNIDRFRREIQLAARLQHACIVPLLSAGVADGIPYYTMPFVDGESLRRRIARGGELPINEAVRFLRDIAEALSCAHERGVIHRDIKPDNILLTKHHALVTDFGVAKALSVSTLGDEVTSIGVAIGTPAYMAPEQAVGDPQVDHRADIYAFGVTAYEMLSGEKPFTGRSPGSTRSP